MVEPDMEAAGIEPAQDSPGWLYAIQAVRGGPIKIGWSKTQPGIRLRLRHLQVGNPYPLKVIWQQEGSRRDEHRLHHKYRDSRLLGEWFEATSALASRFGGSQDEHALDDLYERAFDAGWERGFDDANATDEENEDSLRATIISEHDVATRIWILTGNKAPLEAAHRWAESQMEPA